MKNDFDKLVDVAACLDKATPNLSDHFKDLDERVPLYAVTITYKQTYKISVTKIRKAVFQGDGRFKHETVYEQVVELRSRSRSEQIALSANQLITDFEGINFLLYPEFQKNGMIHYHGFYWHPTLTGKLVEDTILRKLRKYGKQEDCKPVSDVTAWLNYIQKEGRPFISNYYEIV